MFDRSELTSACIMSWWVVDWDSQSWFWCKHWSKHVQMSQLEFNSELHFWFNESTNSDQTSARRQHQEQRQNTSWLNHVLNHTIQCNRRKIELMSSLKVHKFDQRYDASQSLRWARFEGENQRDRQNSEIQSYH